MYSNGFYNPFMYNNFMNMAHVNSMRPTIGLSGLLKRFNISKFLNGASKTLNVVNQAIPIYYQIKPMVSNAKTMFKVMKAVKTNENDTTSKRYNLNNNTYSKLNQSDNGNPTFFL